MLAHPEPQFFNAYLANVDGLPTIPFNRMAERGAHGHIAPGAPVHLDLG